MNLKEKLARLDKSSENRSLPELSIDETPEIWVEDFQKEFEARIIKEKNSTVIIKENIYDLDKHL